MKFSRCRIRTRIASGYPGSSTRRFELVFKPIQNLLFPDPETRRPSISGSGNEAPLNYRTRKMGGLFLRIRQGLGPPPQQREARQAEPSADKLGEVAGAWRVRGRTAGRDPYKFQTRDSTTLAFPRPELSLPRPRQWNASGAGSLGLEWGQLP